MRVKLTVLATFCCMAVMAVVPGAGAQQAPGSPTERTGGEVVGASVAHPAKWTVEREPFTFDDTYGFTLWRPDTDAPHDHGGMPALRVALAYDLRPGGIEAAVRERLSEFSDLPATRETVGVAEKGYEGVAVGPVPGSTPYTEVYVPVNGRVYEVNVYAEGPGDEGLDAEDRELLSGLRFEPPSRSVGSLDLPDANAPQVLQEGGDPALVRREEAAHEEAAAETTAEGSEGSSLRATSSRAAVPRYGERRIYEGCWLAKSPFFFQTQHGKYANRGRWANRRPGWTIIGQPNYWAEYTHGNLDYGRCNSQDWTNDKFAIDYPLKRGDVVFSPFKEGRVTFAGRNQSHKNYGIFVIIKHTNGKYVSMSAHLSGLNVSKGDRVTDRTIIGFAGDTGDPSIPVGPVHLHQAFYRYPRFLGDGSPYGGAGLQVLYHHYVGTAARNNGGVYRFGWQARRGIKAKGSYISN